ncbi:uncharacterized protein LOC118732816 isoform X2 [Rhagoletis pomonella]|uniref:uncharacterized protein LOC118732816 isoform X2 n=1 Tax=Rhagoletis pomonella TaxID=28610 RepID=UPI00177F1E08|nr:uncharacterized protein LOC118732816 isoform X2 [Rhagoletis pomonella]
MLLKTPILPSKMLALVVLTLYLSGIVANRLDNLLLKPVMDLVGAEVSPAVSKASLGKLQDRDEDPVFFELRSKGGNSGVQRRSAGDRRDLLQHLFAAYGCLTSIEGWTKLKGKLDFEMLPNKCLDCKRYEPSMDDIFNGLTTVNLGQTHVPSADEQKIQPAFVKTKESSSDNKFINFPPMSNYADFYKDLLTDISRKEPKRAGTAPVIGCDCKVKIDLVDLGQQHYPRYLMNAVCQSNQSPNEYPQKCWRGSYCKPLEYKVKVLTPRTLLDQAQNDPALAWLPDELRQDWKFKTVAVAAGCFCSY